MPPVETAVPAGTAALPRRCPCLSGNGYPDCCGRLHRGEARAATAEQLMRSRYCAFAVGDEEYLLATWHPRTRPEAVELDGSMRWIRLDIERTVRGGLLDSIGLVEFTAYARQDGRRTRQHEVSRFEKIAGVWLYLDAAD